MSRQKLLHELLDEDQEPFFVATRIKKNHTQLQLKKPKPISQPARLAGKFKNSCLFTLPDSPDPRKSPICFSVRNSPKSPNNIFLHVPAKTAALLLDAALKIQRNSAAAKRSPPRFGLFGSLFKRLTNKTKKRSVETITASSCRKTSRADVSIRGHDSSDLDVGSLLDGGDDLVGVDEIDVMISDAEFDFCHESPFRFVLQRSPPRSGDQTPDLPSSPATSPIRHKFEQLGRNNISTDGESLKKLTVDEDEEQCSPVCVLDPPFEDDDEEEDDEPHQHEHHGDNKDDAFDYECSYAIVQRAKQHLLKKLYRFEKLAELDPIELEKRMLEEQYSSDGDSTSANDTDYYYNNNEAPSVTQVLESSFHHPNNVPDGMKKLVADLIAEEERKQRDRDREVVARGVCRRLETWKEVDLDTIDMMVELDLRIDADGWVRRPDREQVNEVAAVIEVAIFGFMVDELTASV